jgi:hypothetical protein
MNPRAGRRKAIRFDVILKENLSRNISYLIIWLIYLLVDWFIGG